MRAGMHACARTLSLTPALYAPFFWRQLSSAQDSCSEATHNCTSKWVASILLWRVHRARKYHFRIARIRGVVLRQFWREENCRYVFFPTFYLFLTVRQRWVPFWGTGKKCCVRSESVFNFAYKNSLGHKHGSRACAYRNLCTLAIRADQFVDSLTQDYRIWHIVI